MMRLLRSLVAVLNEAVAGAFAQGDGAEDVLLAQLRRRLRALRKRSRRLSVGGALLFAPCAAALVVMPLLGGAAWLRITVSAAVGAVMTAAAVGALEASKLVTLIDALEDLLSRDAAMGRLDLVAAFRDDLQADLAPEPAWEPLVLLLATAYETTTAVRVKLQEARIPVAYLNLNQSVADLWRDALRTARRQQRLDALMTRILSDQGIAAYHEPLRKCRARLGV